MDASQDLVNIVKYFSDVIKELNQSFVTLSTYLNSLSAQVEKLPRFKEIETKLESLENKFYNYNEKHKRNINDAIEDSTKAISELDAVLQDRVKNLIEKLNGIEKLISSKVVSEIELKKQEIDLEKTKMTINADIKKTRMINKKDIILKIIQGIGAALLVLMSLWEFYFREKFIKPNINKEMIQNEKSKNVPK